MLKFMESAQEERRHVNRNLCSVFLSSLKVADEADFSLCVTDFDRHIPLFLEYL